MTGTSSYKVIGNPLTTMRLIGAGLVTSLAAPPECAGGGAGLDEGKHARPVPRGDES